MKDNGRMNIEMSDHEFLVRLKKLNLSNEFIKIVDSLIPKEIRHAIRDETIVAISCAWESTQAIKNTEAIVVENKEGGEHDYLTAADLASHDAIFAQLEASGFIHDEILSEESKTKPNNLMGAKRLWIIDELDGTNNAKFDRGNFSNCIGYVEEGVIKAVAVADPTKGDIWFAQKGLGTYLNGKKASVSSQEDLGTAYVATDPYFTNDVVKTNYEVYIEILNQNPDKVAWPLNYGSAVLSQARLTREGTDVYYHYGLKPWDSVASLLVTEAGGLVTDLNGNLHTILSRGIIAGNPELVKELAKITRGRYDMFEQNYK